MTNKKTNNPNTKPSMLFGKSNYKFMMIGVVTVALGFVLMSGGGSDDPNVFNYEMFSTRRIRLAPLTVIAGYMILIYAIMKPSKND